MPRYVVVDGHTVGYKDATYNGGDKLTVDKELGDALVAAGHVVPAAAQAQSSGRGKRSAWTPDDDEDDQEG